MLCKGPVQVLVTRHGFASGRVGSAKNKYWFIMLFVESDSRQIKGHVQFSSGMADATVLALPEVLPDELLQKVLANLDISDLAAAARTCRTFALIIGRDEWVGWLWALAALYRKCSWQLKRPVPLAIPDLSFRYVTCDRWHDQWIRWPTNANPRGAIVS